MSPETDVAAKAKATNRCSPNTSAKVFYQKCPIKDMLMVVVTLFSLGVQ